MHYRQRFAPQPAAGSRAPHGATEGCTLRAMTGADGTTDMVTKLATVAAAAAAKGVLARIAAVVEDIHLDIHDQRWVLWPANGWWAARLDAQLRPMDQPGYVGPGTLGADEVVDRIVRHRLAVSPFDDTPYPIPEESGYG